MSLGATHYLLTDKYSYSKSYLQQLLVELMGGRAAEELTFNEMSTGATNDIERATDIAKKIVCMWGMSDKIGPMTIGKDQGEVFLGKEILSRDVYSDDTAKLVDTEIRALIHQAHDVATDILGKNRELLEIMANQLIEKETLETEDIFGLIREHAADEYKPIIEKKFNKAMEMRMEFAGKQEPVASDVQEPVAAGETAPAPRKRTRRKPKPENEG